MKELIVGTGNPAKKAVIASALAPIGIVIKGTDDLGVTLEIEEDGATTQENARKKATLYARAIGQPVLSLDQGLYLDGLPPDEQPGIDTRSVPGKPGRATDDDLLEFYSRTINALGGRINGHWEYAFCLADPQGQIAEHDFITPRIFVGATCACMIPGYPLESLQVDPASGKYIAEMSDEEQTAFWQKTLGRPLMDFVRIALPRFS